MPPRLAQKLMAGRYERLRWRNPLLDAIGDPAAMRFALRDAVLFSADGVLGILDDRIGQPFDLVDDLPNLGPPFRNFWIEAQYPRDAAKNAGTRIGAIFSVGDDPEEFPEDRPDTRWTLSATLFAEIDGQARGPFYGACVAVAGDGKPLLFVQTQEEETALRMLLPLFFAVCLMHCKNVRSVEHPLVDDITPKRERETRDRGLRYYTLEIDPMRDVLHKEGRIGELGAKQALHLCRGHFKDYRQSGLFGKIKGLFWWDAHARGTADAGVIVKDYDVRGCR